MCPERNHVLAQMIFNRYHPFDAKIKITSDPSYLGWGMPHIKINV